MFDLFTAKVKFAFPCICMGPIHLYGKNVKNSFFLDISSKDYDPLELKLDEEHQGT